jgi:hypothetical protein
MKNQHNGTTRYAGFDPGYNANKVAEVQGDDIFTYALPSSVGLANRSRKDGLSLTGVIRARRNNHQPYRVSFDGVEYLVGPNVGDYTTPIDRMDFDRFTDSPELRATLYAALYRLAVGGARRPHQICTERSERMALAVALPVEVIQNKDEALRVERAMRDWMVGEHVFCVDGVETALTITYIRAKIPQPVATWFDWGLDMTGQWIRGTEAMRAPTLIIDEGYNTLDVLVVEGGRISHRFTGGDTLGMRRAAERLIETVNHRYDVTLELYKSNELVRKAVNGQTAEIFVRGRQVDVTQETKQALGSLESEVHNFIDRAVGKTREEYRVMLTGGGVLAMSTMLRRMFPQATVLYEPVLANARGLAKLAIRPGFLKEE